MEREFVDLATGEKVTMSSWRTVEQDKAYREKLKREREQQVKVSKDKSEHFVFTEMDIEGLEELDNKDLGYFLLLQTFTDYNNILKEDSEDSKVPMNKKQLQEKLNIGRNTLYKVLKSLKRQGLLEEKKIDSYGKQRKAMILTDEYSFRKSVIYDNGKNKKDTDKAVKVFMSELQDIYNQEHIKPADIGFIYKCIPYVHYDSNFLVHNPNFKRKEDADMITVGELSEIQGLSRSVTQTRLKEITWKGMYVFARVKVGDNANETKLKVNPQVIYRKQGKPAVSSIEFYVQNTKKRKNN